ncbi:MAG: YafY family transcriptional regulator [Rhodanobacteraceae bacterium]|nr:YafY family transcriptional regulator [Rhodanobacteraceae bacterium]MBL0042088.1 YafY family transcriptional regulator [Xanthomonadales bacterium]MBP6077588.1 YafY family transcriptional regulator [Xanthomonadales bacterium]
MDRYERILKLHRLLKTARYPVALTTMYDELECSRATLYRDIAFLRDALGAPIESDRDQAAIHYAPDEAEAFELPGLWLSSAELESLLAMHQLIARTGGEMLSGALAPLKSRIDKLLSDQSHGKRWPLERIRVTRALSRVIDEIVFRRVASSVLERRRLKFDYRARSTNAVTERRVSPQRLTHYRENWYLDAWDHEREALRSFALDRMRDAEVLDARADDVQEVDLDGHLASSYGIFSGPPKAWATIRFSPKASRWVADERWHSKQEGRFLDDGRYELRVPYSNARELLMDVLRYGPDAEIVAPVPLREEAKIQLQLAISNYDPASA